MYVADSSYVPEMWLPDGNSPCSEFTVFTKRNAHTTSCPFPHHSAGLMAGYKSWRFVSSCPHPTSRGWNGRNPSEGLQCRFTTTPFPSSMVSVVQIHRALLNRFGRLRCFPNTNTYQLNCISYDGSDQTGVGQNLLKQMQPEKEHFYFIGTYDLDRLCCGWYLRMVRDIDIRTPLR